MTRPLTKEYVPSSVLIHQAIFASNTAKTTVLDMYMSMHKAHQKQNMNIQGGVNSVMRVAKRSMETWFITLSQMFLHSMTGSRQKQPPV